MKLGELVDSTTELGKQWKGCSSKLHGFEDEKLALAEAHRVAAIVGVELYVYTCEHCTKFHFTKKKRGASATRNHSKLALKPEVVPAERTQPVTLLVVNSNQIKRGTPVKVTTK